MARPLIILGAGGNAYDVLDIVDAMNEVGPAWQVVGFLDDHRAPDSTYLGLPILGSLEQAARFSDHFFVSAIRNERLYRSTPDILAKTRLSEDCYATLVHPGAAVSPRAQLGIDVCVGFGVSIAGDVAIEDHVCLSPGCIVGHNAVIGEHSVLAPGCVISGSVELSRCCYVGAAAVIRQRLRIGEGALIGMGAVVVRDVEAGTVVVGNPARPLVSSRSNEGPTVNS